jgi:two-component system, OmpR family, response regulator
MTRQLPVVLVLDDEETIRESLQCYLEAQGWIVVTAESGEQALDALEQQDIDAAIVDIRLPGISGDEMILRAHRRHPDTKFLIFTGSMDFHISPELSRIGMTDQDLFAKPLGDMRILVERIQRLLA